ncbi:hypothetical protein G1C96_0631 [Bifidobacterium sp. DSM 109958]|uniref:Uncharacterized protein n=1 Tax=Bifidobacterium moraviense TaxID=2675323 RepID=A0A7Y0HYS6_9BIFI|nr:hypothetical protein [Bifidobacterium sp. DSM 109958]NMN00054.1 hypothetical protein [Bifidobacterium sp. DSM 109958]
MTRRSFTETERAYLLSLPAVASVGESRITYADGFVRESLTRYLAGESPVGLFREAGLPPELVGHKRIDRAFARWKADRLTILGLAAPQNTASPSAAASDASASPSSDASASSPSAPRDSRNVHGSHGVRDSHDIRDLMIVQQAHYIAHLERRIAELERERAVERTRAQQERPSVPSAS